MVMEFLERRDLAEVIARSGRVAIRDAVDYVLQALRGARRGARARHRAPRSQAVEPVPRAARTARTRVKVLDFGISKILDETESSGGLKAGATTAAHAIMGTPRYMAPEQVSSSKDVDARADVWSMGLILYELLTQHCPFDGDSAGAVLANVLTAPIPPVRDSARRRAA